MPKRRNMDSVKGTTMTHALSDREQWWKNIGATEVNKKQDKSGTWITDLYDFITLDIAKFRAYANYCESCLCESCTKIKISLIRWNDR